MENKYSSTENTKNLSSAIDTLTNDYLKTICPVNIDIKVDVFPLKGELQTQFNASPLKKIDKYNSHQTAGFLLESYLNMEGYQHEQRSHNSICDFTDKLNQHLGTPKAFYKLATVAENDSVSPFFIETKLIEYNEYFLMLTFSKRN